MDSSLCGAAAPQLRPLQLLLPDCVRFNRCSPIASASAAAPRQLFWKIPAHAQCSRTFFAEFEVQKNEVQRSCVTSLVPPHEHPTSVTHTNTRIDGSAFAKQAIARIRIYCPPSHIHTYTHTHTHTHTHTPPSLTQMIVVYTSPPCSSLSRCTRSFQMPHCPECGGGS